MKLQRTIAIVGLLLALVLAVQSMRPESPQDYYAYQPIPTPALPGVNPVYAAERPAPESTIPLNQAEIPTPVLQDPPPPVEQPIEQPIEPVQLAQVEQLAEPAQDPATIPGTPEFNAALADAYNSLPTIQCPCGIVESEPHTMTEREQQYSRQRTR